MENSWKKQASSFKKMFLVWKVEKPVGKVKLWNCIQLSPPTPNGKTFVSWVAPPVTMDKFEYIKEALTKNVGGRQNRSCKTVPYGLNDLL